MHHKSVSLWAFLLNSEAVVQKHVRLKRGGYVKMVQTCKKDHLVRWGGVAMISDGAQNKYCILQYALTNCTAWA